MDETASASATEATAEPSPPAADAPTAAPAPARQPFVAWACLIATVSILLGGMMLVIAMQYYTLTTGMVSLKFTDYEVYDPLQFEAVVSTGYYLFSGLLLLLAGLVTLMQSRVGWVLHIAAALCLPILPAYSVYRLVMLQMGHALSKGMVLDSFVPQNSPLSIALISLPIAYALFLLVWFARPSIRRQMRSWSAKPQTNPPQTDEPCLETASQAPAASNE